MTTEAIPNDLQLALANLPNFSTLDPSSIVTELTSLLAKNRQEIEQLLTASEEPSWENFVAPLEEIGDRLNRYWSPIGHLHGVADSDELRDAYNEAIPMLSQYASEMAQSDGLAKAFRQIKESDAYPSYTGARRKVIDNALRDFRLGGIDLDEEKRERFREISEALARLSTKFGENVLDATQAWQKDITSLDELSGVPESALDLMRQNAPESASETFRLSLDFPCYMPIVTYCDNRALRQEIYEAYVTRASELGPHAGTFDNSHTIDEILRLRHELARTVGFDNYATYSLATKMADSRESVINFLEDLAARSLDAAKRDYAELQTFAADELGLSKLEAWDVAYCSEKLRQRKFDFSQEALRPYFPVDRVIDGLFSTVKKLFGIEIEAVHGVDTWHDDVQVFAVRDGAGALRGLFYVDLYAREQKRGGAWMDECVVRRKLADSVQSPVAYLTCNFTPPVDGKHSLLTHDEVQTLFHEFGHGLHHMLTLVDEASVSGINGVPWDGVELPSQFLENWCWDKTALQTISGHVDDGRPIPEELYARMIAAKNFLSGMQMVRQLEFSLFDFRVHAQYHEGIAVQDLLDEIRIRVAVVPVPAYNRFQHGFSHIFAGGYAAGYYSYKWAEVLSADAFSRFEEEGIFNATTGQAFRECILERGGSEDTMALFERFRGRPPQLEPLLRHAGLSR